MASHRHAPATPVPQFCPARAIELAFGDLSALNAICRRVPTVSEVVVFDRKTRLFLSLALVLPTAAPAQTPMPAARLGVAIPPSPPAKVAPNITSRTAKKNETAIPQFQSAEQIGRWINVYRTKPQPQALPQFFHALTKLNLLNDAESAGLYLGFTGGVLAANPQIAPALVSKMFPLEPEYQASLIKAVAYSGLPGWQDLLRSNAERMPGRVVLIDRFVTGRMPALEGLKLDEGPVPLDVMWGNYFATGSLEPILRIVSVLNWSRDANDVEKLTIGSMAKWTLATNASNDIELRRMLKAALVSQPAADQRVLTEVIAAAETGETAKIRRDALLAIEKLKMKGPEKTRTTAWWGQAGQMALSFGCIAASALGATAAIGIPCVIGGAASTAALKLMTPQ